MTKFSVIIVTGLPGTGKTTLSKKLSKKLKLPVINKDAIKESLFESLGWSDREWSKKLGMATFDLIYILMEALMAAKKSFIIESNFKHEFDSKKFKALKNKYKFFPIQIVCKTDGKVLFDRFSKRSDSKERHPGHRDCEVRNELKDQLIKGSYKPLQIGGKKIEVDTTVFKSINYKNIIKEISES